MEDVLRSSPTAFMVLDRDLRIAWANEAVSRFFGIPAAELIGQFKPQLVRERLQHIFSDPEGFASRVLQAYETNRYDQAFDCHVLPGEGREERWLHHWSHPIETGIAAGGRVEQYIDITPRKQAETDRERLADELTAERERLRSVILHAPAPMALHTGPEHRFTIINDALRRVSGGRDITGMTPQEAYPEVVGQGILERLDEVYATGEPWTSPETYARYDRRGQGVEETWFDIRFEPVRDAAGQVFGVLNFSFDVTEQVRARREVERLLQEARAARAIAQAAERQLQMAFLQAPALVAVTEGPQHRFVLANPGFEQIAGRGNLVGRTVWEALPELEAQGIFALLDQVYATGEAFVANEQRILLPREGKDPYEGWYNFVYQPLLDAEGQVTGILQHVVEVTEQVRSHMEVEEARRAAEARSATLSAVFESIPDALYVGTLEGITAANRPALEQLGFESFAELQRGVPALADEIQTRDADTGRRLTTEEEPFVRALLRGERVIQDVLVRQRGTGEDRVVRCSAAPVRVDGKVIASVAVNTDVTDVRRAAEERERLLSAAQAAREEAERANRAKAEFLAVMSHELRTPLNAISGYAELLEMGIHGPITEAQRRALSRIQLSQQHLLGLINEVLNYARLESGSVHFDIGDVRLRDLLATIEGLIEPQVRAKGLTLEIGACPPDLTARADPEKLRQILVNLASNAIKFTDEGGRIELACEPHGEHVRLVVRDTGIGVPADRLEAIFEPFVQVRADLTRTAEGTGLGLAISRDLAHRMEGELTVESTLGEGSAFTVQLPREAAEPVGRGSMPNLSPRALTAVAELLLDHRDAILSAYAERMRHDPIVGTVAASQADLALKDHGVNFLAGVSQSLSTRAANPETAGALSDDTDTIQRTIAELHGTQRRRMGFSEEALQRDWTFLREETERVVREQAPEGLEITGVLDLLERIFDRAERHSQRAWRRSPAAAQ